MNDTNKSGETVICWASQGPRVLQCLRLFAPGRPEDPGDSAVRPGPALRTCCDAAPASWDSWGPAQSSRVESVHLGLDLQPRPSSLQDLQLRPPSPDCRVPVASLQGLQGQDWSGRSPAVRYKEGQSTSWLRHTEKPTWASANISFHFPSFS